jgi:hypothetical protein
MVDGMGLRRKPNAVVRLGRFPTNQFSKPNALGMTFFMILLLIGNDTIKAFSRCMLLAQQPYLLSAHPFLKVTPACLALLCSRTLSVLPTWRGARLPSPSLGARLPGPARSGARPLPPCRVAQPPPSAHHLHASSGCCILQTPHTNEPPLPKQ